MASSNLPEKGHGNGALVQAPDAAGYLDEMVIKLPVLDEEDLTARTLARIMNASELEDVFANPELEGVRDNIGRVVILERVIGRRLSTYTEDRWYLMYEATDPDTGERINFASGSPYVAASALTAQRKGLLPAPVRIVGLESKGKPGQMSLWLVFTRLNKPVTEPAAVE
jgi:hypothetical protein